jgi:hypothetical protein
VEFTLTFRPDSEDLATAQALGWQSGIPAADVAIRPVDSSAAPQTFRSSAQGAVVLASLPPGDYLVEAQRWLSGPERAALPPRDDAVGFATLRGVRVPVGGGAEVVTVPASRRRSLVISEWAFNRAGIPGSGVYPYGGFLELYNNADTTAFLDGLTIVQGIVLEWDTPPNARCQVWATYTNDPSGIWTRHVQQFPGRGRDYPLAPGQAVVIATDAIDHRPLFPNALDLSHSDFEFWGGPGDIDNPAVPNMIDTLSLGYDLTGHGPSFGNIGAVAVLARPYELATVPRSLAPDGKEWALVPADRILDVVSIWPNYVAPWPRCPQLVNNRFDRASSDARSFDAIVEYEFSVARRPIQSDLAGRPILQSTRDSYADFARILRSPGTVP